MFGQMYPAAHGGLCKNSGCDVCSVWRNSCCNEVSCTEVTMTLCDVIFIVVGAIFILNTHYCVPVCTVGAEFVTSAGALWPYWVWLTPVSVTPHSEQVLYIWQDIISLYLHILVDLYSDHMMYYIICRLLCLSRLQWCSRLYQWRRVQCVKQQRGAPDISGL